MQKPRGIYRKSSWRREGDELLSVFSYYVKTPFASPLFADTILVHLLLGRCIFSDKNVYHLEVKTLFRSRKAPEKSVTYGNSFSYFIFFSKHCRASWKVLPCVSLYRPRLWLKGINKSLGKVVNNKKDQRKNIFRSCKYFCLHKLNYNLYVLDYMWNFIPHLKVLRVGSHLSKIKQYSQITVSSVTGFLGLERNNEEITSLGWKKSIV